jgi:hypothetical protein
MTAHEEILLDGIRNLRRHNNDHWMALVRLALTHAPEETKKIMREISRIDREVVERWRELSQ